jgi:hypothetical protein
VNRASFADLRARYRNARLADRAENRLRHERAATDPLRRSTASFWPTRRWESAVVDHLPPELRLQLQAKPATRDELDPRSRNLRAVVRFHAERRYKADVLRESSARLAAIPSPVAPACVPHVDAGAQRPVPGATVPPPVTHNAPGGAFYSNSEAA